MVRMDSLSLTLLDEDVLKFVVSRFSYDMV
jgi:hypothetical protein